MQFEYKTAIRMGEEKLKTLDAQQVCARTGARVEDGDYVVPWMGKDKRLGDARDAERVLFLHYLCSEGTKAPTGQLISYRQVKNAAFYEPKFIARAVRPIVKRFGKAPEGLVIAGEALGGVRSSQGDASVTVPVFPNLPVTYILWRGDEEFGADGQILFDSTADGWLSAEDLVVAASLGAYRMAAFQ